MNERIGKLTEQAEEWVCKNYPDAMDDNDEFHAQTMEKFAELIVKECMAVAAKQRKPANLNYNPGERFVEDLRQHFGVEE